MRLSPPATSPKLFAPSDLKPARQRRSAFSVKIRCAQGNTENRCPPRGCSQVGPKEIMTRPSGLSRLLMMDRIDPGSSKCSKASMLMMTSALSSVVVWKLTRSSTFLIRASERARSRNRGWMSRPITREPGHSSAISTDSRPQPQPKSMTVSPSRSLRNPSPKYCLSRELEGSGMGWSSTSSPGVDGGGANALRR